MSLFFFFLFFFFFNDTASTEIYTLSLHDALPISAGTVAPYPDLVGKICPKPRRTGAIVGDAFIVKRYNCPTATCGAGKNHIDTLQSYQSGITNGNAGSQGWYVVNSCPGGDADIGTDLLAAGYPVGTPIYVKDSNCQIKGTVKFPGSSTVIFA